MSARDMVESDALRSFAIFAEHRNFTTAAAALNISQPSLHVKIRKLASALGADLYERSGRSLVLTAAGEQLAAFAVDSRLRVDDFLSGMEEGTATLTIAAGRGAFQWVIPEAVRAVVRRGRKIRVITADRDGAIAALGAGLADIAVTGYDPPPFPFEACVIATYPQTLVISRAHPLAGRERVSLRDLAGLDLIVPPPGQPHRRALERALADVGVRLRAVAEADGWDLQVHFVDLGVGAAVVNGCVRPPSGLVAVPVSGLPDVSYWAAWRPQRHTRIADLLAEL